MNRIVGLVFSVLILTMMSGCLSSMVYNDSKKKIYTRKAILSNNQRAIRAVQLGDGGVGIGIDVSNLEALSEQPWLQLGAAAGDAALIWGTYQGVKSITDNSSHNGDTTSGRDNVNVNGDGNTVNVGNSKTDTDNSAK